jgi:hypothetical protein
MLLAAPFESVTDRQTFVLDPTVRVVDSETGAAAVGGVAVDRMLDQPAVPGSVVQVPVAPATSIRTVSALAIAPGSFAGVGAVSPDTVSGRSIDPVFWIVKEEVTVFPG